MNHKYSKWTSLISFNGIALSLSLIFRFISIPLFTVYLRLEISDLFVLLPFIFFAYKTAFFSALLIGLTKNLIFMAIQYWDGYWPGHLITIISTITLTILFFLIILLIQPKRIANLKILTILGIVGLIVLIMSCFIIINDFLWSIRAYYHIINIRVDNKLFVGTLTYLIIFNIIKYTFISAIFIWAMYFFDQNNIQIRKKLTKVKK